MSFIDNAKAMAMMPVPGPGTPDDARAAFNAMSIAELAARWRMLQFVGLRQHSEATWTASRYFDHLPHEQPARAYDVVIAVLATETDMSVRLRLHDMMSALIHAHGAMLVDRLEADAVDNDGLRWLLGGGCWWTQDKALEERLTAIADVEQFAPIRRRTRAALRRSISTLSRSSSWPASGSSRPTSRSRITMTTGGRFRITSAIWWNLIRTPRSTL